MLLYVALFSTRIVFATDMLEAKVNEHVLNQGDRGNLFIVGDLLREKFLLSTNNRNKSINASQFSKIQTNRYGCV